MKPVTIKDRDTRSVEGRDRLLTALSEAATAEVNGELRGVQVQIDRFEKHYGINSATMLLRLETGDLTEDEEVCSWLMALKVRQHLVSRQARAN